MIKNTIIFISISLFIACSINQTQKKKLTNQSSLQKNNPIEKTAFDLNGMWGLSNYFDTIVLNKELAKYRVQTPSWFAILLEIENDSLRNFGSIEYGSYSIDKTRDTLSTLSSDVSGEFWHLILEPPYLKMIQAQHSGNIDSTVYMFRKREDLDYFTKENTGPFIIDFNVTDYFNEQLFMGKFINKTNKQEVVFGENRQLSGLGDFDVYEIRNYFGTLHMHKNLDVITFKNTKENTAKQYNWAYSENELLLTEFVPEQITRNGKTYDGDYLVLGSEKIRLIKQ